MVTGSRDTTTVAPQALYLLNDPFVRREAQGLADRLLHEEDPDLVHRIQSAYRLTLDREATANELRRATLYISEYEDAVRESIAARKKAGSDGKAGAADPKAQAWASFCQALLGSAEFRYVR
jgi:hypothetical protein